MFKDENVDKNMWKMGVYPQAAEIVSVGSALNNAWFLNQITSISGSSIVNPRLVVLESGEVAVSRRLVLFNNLGTLATGVKGQRADIWVDNLGKLHLSSAGNDTAFVIDYDGQRACPTSYVKQGSVCVNSSLVAAKEFDEASSICSSNGARLCSYSEWVSVCRNRVSNGANFDVGAWEWVDDFLDEGKVLRAAYNSRSCDARESKSPDSTGGFRCCISR